jgi:hypothetical protein
MIPSAASKLSNHGNCTNNLFSERCTGSKSIRVGETPGLASNQSAIVHTVDDGNKKSEEEEVIDTAPTATSPPVPPVSSTIIKQPQLLKPLAVLFDDKHNEVAWLRCAPRQRHFEFPIVKKEMNNETTDNTTAAEGRDDEVHREDGGDVDNVHEKPEKTANNTTDTRTESSPERVFGDENSVTEKTTPTKQNKQKPVVVPEEEEDDLYVLSQYKQNYMELQQKRHHTNTTPTVLLQSNE